MRICGICCIAPPPRGALRTGKGADILALLHGWLLDGSGSNLWTRSVVTSLCRTGHDVHLVCQENHPERFDFIASATTYRRDGSTEVQFARETPYAGKCFLHKPELAGVLPVFVWDKYDEHPVVVPMIELSDEVLEAYIARNVEVVARVASEFGVTAMHANHAVLMPEVAARVARARNIPFTVMPHGSDIEYAVKKDPRFLRYATEAMAEAGRIFVIGDEMRSRVHAVFGDLPGLDAKLSELHLGVDTSQFQPEEPSGRVTRIARLADAVAGLSPGRERAAAEQLEAELRQWSAGDDLTGIFARAGDYDGKKPDADLPAKLNAIDWGAPTALFVGRLIAAKGIQSIIAALPAALSRRPDLQLVVVGHGPLREVMEALVLAISERRRDLIDEIVRRGRELEGGSPEDHGLAEVATYFSGLAANGTLDSLLDGPAAARMSKAVTFTGYLTHHELKHLFACCDVGIFPSVVKEAGPLVFLEAIASGCFPLGTYFGGMAASIDAVGGRLGPGVSALMSLSPDRTAADLAEKLPLAVAESPKHRLALSAIAREHYDWSAVASKLLAELDLLSGRLHE